MSSRLDGMIGIPTERGYYKPEEYNIEKRGEGAVITIFDDLTHLFDEGDVKNIEVQPLDFGGNPESLVCNVETLTENKVVFHETTISDAFERP